MSIAKRVGFTLIELMIVVAIIAFLSMVAMPSFMRFLSKAKRAEAYMNLSALYTAQKAFHAEYGKYASVLQGTAESLGWKPEGNFYYTYGLGHGTEGQHYIMGKLKTPISAITQAASGAAGFIGYALGDIDGDGKPDILGVKDTGEIVIVQDDLV